MKNSKLISLLSAGALFASSFSGLMINGGVAFAAKETTAASTAVIEPSEEVVFDTTAGQEMYYATPNDTFSITAAKADGKYTVIGATNVTATSGKLSANVAQTKAGLVLGDITGGKKVTGASHWIIANEAGADLTVSYTTKHDDGTEQFINVGVTDDETKADSDATITAGTGVKSYGVKVLPVATTAEVAVTSFAADDKGTAFKTVEAEIGKTLELPVYVTLTATGALFESSFASDALGDASYAVTLKTKSSDAGTNKTAETAKLVPGSTGEVEKDSKRLVYNTTATLTLDTTGAKAGQSIVLTLNRAAGVFTGAATADVTVKFVEAEEPAVAALSALTADGTEVTTVEPGEAYTIAAVDENGDPVDYDGADLTVDGPATFDAETFALTVVEDAEDGAEITLTLGEATATLTVEVSDVDPETVEVEGLDEETGELVPGAEYDLAAKDKDGNDIVLTEDDLKDVDPAGAVSIVDGKLVIADDLEDGTIVSFTLGGKAFTFTVNAAAPVPAQIAPQLSALPNSARAWTRLNFTDCGPVRTWREEFGNYYQGLASVLEEVTVPVNEKSNELGFYYGIYNQQLNTAVDGFNTRIGVSRRANTNYYVTASSSNEGVAYTKEYEINNDYGFMRVYANGVGTATITVSLFYRTAAEVANQAVGTEVGSASVVVNLVAAPGRTVTYVDEVQRNAVVLTSVKPEAVLYTQAIDGDFVASKNVKWYEADARLVQISDKTATDRITVKSLGRGNTLIYAVPEALVERFENAYNWWIANQVNNINTKWSRANALAYAYNNVLFNSIGGTGITQFQVTASGVEREMFVYEDDEWLTSVSLAQSDSKVVSVGLNDNDYAAGIAATNVSFKVNGSVADEKVATLTKIDANSFKITGVAPGTTKITFKGEWLVNGTAKSDEVELTVKVLADGETPAEDVKKAGDPVKESGVVGVVNEDGKTVTVTDVTVVEKGITIPETVEGLTVTKIAPQVFKKTKAKHLYVKAAVEEIGKGAFKSSSLKKAYFYQPAALKTVGKNAFKKTSVKVVGVGAAFSDDAATALKKNGAKSVKNNATAK